MRSPDISVVRSPSKLKTNALFSERISYSGGAENDGHENDGSSKCTCMNLTDVKLTDQVSGHEIGKHKINGRENARHVSSG